MPKSNTKQRKPNNGSDITQAATLKKPQTLAEFYAHAHELTFNKLTKEQRAVLLINLQNKPEIIRGRERFSPDVETFVKAVAALGEELYEKQASKAKDASR